ncbi:uncharacterized protein C2845_PM06G14260 [Panicum miliaceum]|uniref:Uncharacterized protein n=1 Tax=Panicum miliaceum TaxID=4540 RepID=A0A3L6RDK7_PANMI|nr:uncharacterized protein C2845_PM06G14260 [Panicum miliaceum]
MVGVDRRACLTPRAAPWRDPSCSAHHDSEVHRAGAGGRRFASPASGIRQQQRISCRLRKPLRSDPVDLSGARLVGHGGASHVDAALRLGSLDGSWAGRPASRDARPSRILGCQDSAPRLGGTGEGRAMQRRSDRGTFGRSPSPPSQGGGSAAFRRRRTGWLRSAWARAPPPPRWLVGRGRGEQFRFLREGEVAIVAGAAVRAMAGATGRERDMEGRVGIKVRNADFSTLTISDNTASAADVSYHLAVKLSLYNPSARVNIYYDALDAELRFRDAVVISPAASDTSPSEFYQRSKTNEVVKVEFDYGAPGVAVAGDVAGELEKGMRSGGPVSLDLHVGVQVRYVFRMFKLRQKPRIWCPLSIPVRKESRGRGVGGLLVSGDRCRVKY